MAAWRRDRLRPMEALWRVPIARSPQQNGTPPDDEGRFREIQESAPGKPPDRSTARNVDGIRSRTAVSPDWELGPELNKALRRCDRPAAGLTSIRPCTGDAA